jgi:TonB family protein
MNFLELSTAWSLQILLIGACAEAGAPLLGKAHPRIRARFWLVALLLSLGAPWLMPGGSAPATPGESSGFAVTASTFVGAVSAIGPSWQSALSVLWGFIALVRVIRLARALGRLASITAESRPVEVADVAHVRVRETSAIQSPAASFIGRVILVPGTFHGLPEAWRRAALVHESIHLRRGHGLLLLVEELVLALFWFHPVVFRLIRRVRDSREELVDAETLEVTGAGREYRDMLIGLAARIRIPAPAVSGTTALGARIESLIALEEDPMPVTSTPRLLAAGFALLCTAALASAAVPIGTGAQGAPTDDMKAAAKAPRKVISKVNPVYPAALREKRVEGVVQIEVVFDSTGAFTRATPRPEDNPELVKAAIGALRQWRWEPGEGAIQMTHTIQFRLAKEAEKK